MLCDLLNELSDRTPEIAFRNEAMTYLELKKDLETYKSGLVRNPNLNLNSKQNTDLFLKEDFQEQPNEKQPFDSFKNMEKKPLASNIMSPNKEMGIEESGTMPERVSSINKDNKANTSSFNVSTQHQLSGQSYPHTFVIYKTYSILDTKDSLKDSPLKDKNAAWLKDKTSVAVQKYRTLAAMIEKHLADKRHPLCAIKNRYIEYFIRLYNRNSGGRDSKKPEDAQKEIRFMTRDVKSFVWVFKEAILNFYELEIVSKKFKTNDFDLFSDFNMITFIYSLVFTDEVYSIFFEMLKITEKFKEIIYKRNIELLRYSSPERFLVQDKFCLNKRTTAFFAKIHPEAQNFIRMESDDFDLIDKKEQKPVKTRKINYHELQNRIFPHLLLNSFHKHEFKKVEKSERSSEKSNEEKKSHKKPYSDSVDLLKNLQFLKNPAHKIKLITNSFDLIEETIREYYNAHSYEENYIVLEPEDFISIIVYVMSQLSLNHILIHCNFIELFFNEMNLSPKSACYLYSLKTAIEYLLNAIEEND